MKSIIDYTNELKSFFAEKQALSNYVADYGVKNLLENTSSSVDANGIHFVVNSDGTVTVSTESGGATINTPLNIATGITINKPVRLSGCPSGGSLNSYWLDTGVTTYADIGSGVSVNSLSNATIRLIVKAGTVITTPIVFKPMITDADAPNSDYNHYVPYAMTNRELTEGKADKSDLASIDITGTTNNTGATITIGTYFYLNGVLVKAKTGIANGATLTSGTNYENVTVGSLNQLQSLLNSIFGVTGSSPSPLSCTSMKFSGTDDYFMQVKETGDEDYKGIQIKDKNDNIRYSLTFKNGHLFFYSKDASGNMIVNETQII